MADPTPSPTRQQNFAVEAKNALLAIWPTGKNCQHEHARAAFEFLEKAEQREAELTAALESMCHQYLAVRGGKLHHDFMSAGEAAFDALGWDDAGHVVDPSCLCEVPGCGQSWTSGINGKDDKYHCLCNYHAREFYAANQQETAEQARLRWRRALAEIGMSEAEIDQHEADLKAQREAWAKQHQAVVAEDGAHLAQQVAEAEAPK